VASEGLHEPGQLLDEETIDRHRAFTSLAEELEAIDWYDQRVRATADPGLAEVLAHNRDDEKEHAAMVLEWIRRHDPAFDDELRRYLFTTDSIIGASPDVSPNAKSSSTSSGSDGSLGIASLRGKE
jgi:ferritin-like protein